MQVIANKTLDATDVRYASSFLRARVCGKHTQMSVGERRSVGEQKANGLNFLNKMQLTRNHLPTFATLRRERR